MRKLILSFLTIIFFINNSNSQCAFTGTPLTQVGGTNTFCIDNNSNTITTASVRAGQFVLVNVVQGFAYTFSVGNVFSTLDENLTLLDTANANLSPAVFNSGSSGTSISYTATFSGQIKILLSKGTCVNDNTTGGALTIVLNTASNTFDNQLGLFANDQWLGHVYNWTGSPPPGGASPSSPTATYPFVTAGYAGNYAITTESFVETFGGDGNCFQLFSNGVNRVNILTTQYAVRYRMRSTRPAGCYVLNFNGDDGIRVYVDGALVFNEWKEQSPTLYNNVLVYLNGASDIVFDYYENGGQNRVNFGITPFDGTANTVAAPNINTFCSGATPAVINGSAFAYTGNIANPTLAYRWQISDDNISFTDISGATSEDYQPAPVSAPTVNVLKYYRRILKAAAATATSCEYISNSVLITTTPGTYTSPNAVSGVSNQCPLTTGLIYSVGVLPSALSYNWFVPTGWTITAGATTNSITVTSGNAGQNGIISCSANYFCGSSSFRNLNVNAVANTVAGTVTAAQTICSGTQPASIASNGRTGNILKWQRSSDAAFTAPTDIAITSGTLTSANIGVLTANTYFRAVVQSSPCAILNSSSVLITVIQSEAGTVSSSQAICTGTSPSNLTLSGNVGSVVKWQSSSDFAFTLPVDIINTTTTLTGAAIGNLTATTYFRAVVQLGSCPVVNTNIVIITIADTTWNGTIWSNGIPTITTTAFITGNFTSSTDIFACSLTVSNNAVVNILATHNVTLNGKLTVDSGSSFTLNNNTNLIQLTNVANTGDITVKRNSNALFRLDYTQWSTPVIGAKTLLQFTPLTTQASAGPPVVSSRFYVYNSVTNTYNNAFNPATTTFDVAKGYHLRMPNNWVAAPAAPAIFTGIFTGVPNNGPQTFTMSNTAAGKGFNLVGNPYPSDISIASFVAGNSTAITGTLYFWRKTNNTAVPSYSTVVGTTFTQGTSTATDPNGIISVGQGFIVEATSGQTNLTFNNSMRVVNNTDHFFRNQSNIEHNRIWLNATNDSGAFCQTAIGYITDATNGVDNLDGLFFNDGVLNLTSLIGTNDYAIQGRALPFNNNDIVPLSFKTATAGNFTIAIDHVDGLFSGTTEIYLKDNFNNTINNLTTSSYSFAADAGKDNTRFELMYVPTVLAVDKNNFIENNVLVFKSNDLVNIESGTSKIVSVKIFDLQGRLLIDKTKIDALKSQIDASMFANQMFVIQITFENNVILSRKIVN